MPHPAVIKWLDGQEIALNESARVAGLLEHNTMVGQAREFLINKVLKSILPAAVHFGTGKIIDSQGSYSKQIDIIVYDARFPALEIEGSGLYMVEGVIAAIEVKSTLDTGQLILALDNCKSVLDLMSCGEDEHQMHERIDFYKRSGGLTDEHAQERFTYNFLPETYIFSFTSDLKWDTSFDKIYEWWSSADCPKSPYFPRLPKLIVTGRAVGVANDGLINFNTFDSDGMEGSQKGIFLLFETERKFRWLALHLVNKVSARLGLTSHSLGGPVTYGITDYFDMEEFVKSIGPIQKRITWAHTP